MHIEMIENNTFWAKSHIFAIFKRMPTSEINSASIYSSYNYVVVTP